ncbi:1452_t:CDS:1 [Funneliformis geosporum]|uniref:16031_t:CDS:1 n=1 Tax=Funneliformis geosporum TaxID=1117311 RepID=A0A9W4WYR3_9GLOM|nr:1452_t:CDS:1 [Funneliformis geosporum]CAI2182286.1 16031_t:CDS:1 [Funneliformis geosporum]
MKSDLSNIAAPLSMIEESHKKVGDFQFIMENKQPGKATNLRHRIVPDIPANFKVPYPPKTTAEEIVEKAKSKNNTTKSPNKFLIYRKEFVDELHNYGFQCSMTDISKTIGEWWKKEPKHVQDTYQKISTEANRLHKQSSVHSIAKKKNRKKALIKSSANPAVDVGFTPLNLSVPVNFSCEDNLNFPQLYAYNQGLLNLQFQQPIYQDGIFW